jgi:curved DNA-binding protein CbpA
MAPTLETARRCARQGSWHTILGLPQSASADAIRRARRRLQLRCHEDKGGSGELSQLINRAADVLLERCPEVRAKKAQARAREEAEEKEVLERQRAQEREERARRLEQIREEERQCYLKRALAEASARGARSRKGVYLSWSTSCVFPRLRWKIYRLQARQAYARARCLTYAAEAEIAARRAVRETRFPRTCRLEARDPAKAEKLARIKVVYDRAYQHLCYVRRAQRPERCAALAVTRLLREAWGVLMAQPAPWRDEGEAIPLGARDSPGFF